MPVCPSVPNGVPKMMRYSVMEACMMYMAPIAPPALLRNHSDVSVLMITVGLNATTEDGSSVRGAVCGNVAVKLARMWLIMPWVSSGEAAMASFAS